MVFNTRKIVYTKFATAYSTNYAPFSIIDFCEASFNRVSKYLLVISCPSVEKYSQLYRPYHKFLDNTYKYMVFGCIDNLITFCAAWANFELSIIQQCGTMS